MRTKERADINVLKAVAILAVVLYHLGVLDSGYLGVDVFLVVNGYLIIPKLVKQIAITGENDSNTSEEKQFYYLSFLKKRLMRLWPLVIVGSMACLLLGAISMLPHDYKVVGVSAISSVLFSTNILQYLTTKDYWAVANNYRPLMHLWYLGILVEFYAIYPLILIGTKKILKKFEQLEIEKALWIVSALLGGGSILIFFLPCFSQFLKFYMLPFRLFEMIGGGLVGLFIQKVSQKQIKYAYQIKWIAWIFLLLVLNLGFLSWDGSVLSGRLPNTGSTLPSNAILSNNVLVPVVVVLTMLIIFLGNEISLGQFSFLCYVGKMSYSIYIWHQIILAFYRYYVNSNYGFVEIFCYILITFIVSVFSYLCIERCNFNNHRKIWVFMAIGLCSVAGIIYFREGIIRDVPELDVYAAEPNSEDCFEYVDRIYEYNNEFESTEKIKVLVVGNSFARDWSNILLESEMKELIELSYSYNWSMDLSKRLEECDYLFTYGKSKDEIPKYVWDYVSEKQVYAIGTKSFGRNMGEIYARRFFKDYYDQTVFIDDSYRECNQRWRESWGEEHFIDLLEHSTLEDGSIRVFTNEGKLMSADAIHLTRAGACYYAATIDLKSIFDLDIKK